jgi:hypothetical protein
MKGALKLGIAATVAAGAAAVLVVAAAGARERGRDTYCRNNLRRLGDFAFQKLSSEDRIPETGRNYWQEIRREQFTTVKGGKETWVLRFAGLNPFGCPVRGVQPLDLSELSQEDLDRVMGDPATIDYRGPRAPPGAQPPPPDALGADRPGNHPNGGGHVLLADLRVKEIREAVVVKPLRDAPAADAEVSD